MKTKRFRDLRIGDVIYLVGEKVKAYYVGSVRLMPSDLVRVEITANKEAMGKGPKDKPHLFSMETFPANESKAVGFYTSKAAAMKRNRQFLLNSFHSKMTDIYTKTENLIYEFQKLNNDIQLEREIVIVDVDGTLANQSHREHFLAGDCKDWSDFFEACDKDEPHWDIINLIRFLALKYRIVFFTGRPENVRAKTEAWLNDVFNESFKCELYMRPAGNTDHDIFVKPKMIERAGISKERVAFILEDRNSMVKEWRRLGYRCLQVAEGDF